jgi:hypothetical protein
MWCHTGQSYGIDRTVWYRIKWADGHETVHCTAWDAWRDRVISDLSDQAKADRIGDLLFPDIFR